METFGRIWALKSSFLVEQGGHFSGKPGKPGKSLESQKVSGKPGKPGIFRKM